MTVRSNKEDIDKLLIEVDLVDEHCHLKHNQQHDPVENHPAVGYLVQYLGRKTDDFIQEAEHELRIPICQDCIDGLSDPNWFLVYCIICNNNQWIYRPLYYKPLPDIQIQWVDECPHCKQVKM